jgi:hypothetical protein
MDILYSKAIADMDLGMSHSKFMELLKKRHTDIEQFAGKSILRKRAGAFVFLYYG